MTEAGKEPAPAKGSAPVPKWLTLVLGSTVVVLSVGMLSLALNPAPHNGGDNAGYLTLAHSLITDGAYVDRWDPAGAPHTKYPPLYPAVLSGAMLLGASSWISFKILSMLFVVGSAWVVYVWVAERRGPWGAAVLAMMVVISPAFLWASNWILSDPLFVLVTLFALWSLERAEGRESPTRVQVRWMTVGGAAAVLSTFTRTAGLPLILAVGLSWALRRRWRALTVFAFGFGLPSIAWWLRARSAGDAQYVSEFWMVNPYQPELGRAGAGDLVSRVWDNAQGYVLSHIPAGLTTYSPRLLGTIGLVLFGLAVIGWTMRARRRLGVTEIFAPVYLGLILLWPVVWSGDRLALPLYPLVLFYAWEGLDVALGRVRSWMPTVAAAALGAVIVIPSLRGWSQSVEQARACGIAVEAGGPFACYHTGYVEFAAASRWLGENAPDGAVSFTRKPRIFHTLSGLRSRTYPFTEDADAFLEEAQSLGVRYVILDRVDRLGITYVGSVVSQRPERFCLLASFGPEGGLRTEVLGLLARREESADTPDPSRPIQISRCGSDMVRETPRRLPPYSASELPLLALPTP